MCLSWSQSVHRGQRAEKLIERWLSVPFDLNGAPSRVRAIPGGRVGFVEDLRCGDSVLLGGLVSGYSALVSAHCPTAAWPKNGLLDGDQSFKIDVGYLFRCPLDFVLEVLAVVG